MLTLMGYNKRILLVIVVLLFMVVFATSTAFASCGLSPLNTLASGAEHTITPNKMPWVDWTRGCTPTSASMVLGYHNERRQYERLMDYWQDLSEYTDGRNGVINNVPNVLDELRTAMGTDVNGGTFTSQIGPGILSVTNTLNGYSFSSSQCVGSSINDHCWGTITNEVNNFRPFVWSVGNSAQGGHSLAACGYTDDKYVMNYNTWYPGTDYWYYTRYNNGQYSTWQYVDTAVPGGGNSSSVFLSYPNGGEILHGGQATTIAWIQYGSGITWVSIFYSSDGGTSWNYVTDTPSGVGMFGWSIWYYTWNVPYSYSNLTRVKIVGHNASGQYIGGDGSQNDFTITQ